MTKALGRILLLLGVAAVAPACGGGSPADKCPSSCDGTCSAGHCLTTLASGLSAPGALAVDGTSVYFAMGGVPTGSGPGIMVVPKVPTTAGSRSWIAEQEHQPWALAVDGTSVYWTTDYPITWPGGGTVQSRLLDGTSPATLSASLDLPRGLAIDATSVYWTEGGGRVAKAPLGGAPPTVLASGLDFPGDIAVDATNVYWVEGGTDGKPPPEGDTKLMMVPKAGGTPTTLATAGMLVSGGSLTVDATNVYWTISVYQQVNGASVCTLGKVLSVPIAGGAATTLTSGQNGPGAIAVDATSLYWINEGSKDDGAIMKIPKGGGAAITLAANLTDPSRIVVDDTAVYWTDGGVGGVVKTAKD
jgi:hypothetical protein